LLGSLNDRDALAKIRGLSGGFFACGTASDYYEIKLFARSHQASVSITISTLD
jgi:hypothetical protein